MGPDRLTTNRVAERAGVSVGTLYQYYPNKQALLYALLDNHMNKASLAVERACEEARGKPLPAMLRDVVQRFVDAKMVRADISTALYRISTDVGGPAVVKRTVDRSRKALEAVLQTAPEIARPPDRFAIEMMLSAMSGAVRSVLEAGATPAMVAKLRKHLVLLCQSYMTTQVIGVSCAPGSFTKAEQDALEEHE